MLSCAQALSLRTSSSFEICSSISTRYLFVPTAAAVTIPLLLLLLELAVPDEDKFVVVAVVVVGGCGAYGSSSLLNSLHTVISEVMDGLVDDS